MFRTFSTLPPLDTNRLLRLHPSDLTALLEFAWDNRRRSSGGNPVALGHPDNRSDLEGLGGVPATWLHGALFASTPANPDTGAIKGGLVKEARGGVLWEHLIYAYMIENTRVIEIFRRVLLEFLHGEKLGAPGTTGSPGLQSDSLRWLRTTEELFFRDGAPFFISTVTSRLRPDIQAVGRNAYQRMFGMDLNHGTEDNKPYPYTKAEAANTGFVLMFEELLREVWVGIENFNNGIGPKPTDDAKIADLVRKLRDMLITRRQGGNLSREEFVLISMLSWFHLTVSSNTPIVQDLRADAASPEERLFKIAQRVGLPAHGLSRSYFDIADSISRILIGIEADAFSTPLGAPTLYTPLPGGPEEDMKTIIRHWSIITGREMKARKVAPS
jgi:hypothetical protein